MTDPFKSFRGNPVKSVQGRDDGDGAEKVAPPPDFELAPLTTYDPEVFRSADRDVDAFVLSLALGFNDLKAVEWVMKQVQRGRPSEPTVDAESGQIYGMSIWAARMTLAMIHELLNAVKVAAKEGVLSGAEFTTVVESLDPRSHQAWSAILAVATNTAKSGMAADVRKYMEQVRHNAAFHYYQPTELRRGYDAHFFDDKANEFNAHAYASIGDTMRTTRYYFADAAVSRYYDDGGAKRELFAVSNKLRPVISLALRGVVQGYLEIRAAEIAAERQRTT